MRTLTARAAQAFGAHPVQLPLYAVAFALTSYTLWLLGLDGLWNPDVWWQSIAVWLLGAAVAHDLLLFPAYAAADRVLAALTRRRSGHSRGVPLVNFVRVPLMACALVTLLFLPGIVRQGTDSYARATGQTQEPFLLRWLLLCVAIVMIGLLSYLVAQVRMRSRPVRLPTNVLDAASQSQPDSELTGARSPEPTRAVPRRRSPRWRQAGLVVVAAIALIVVVQWRRAKADR